MVRLFKHDSKHKDPAYSLKCIAGEMLNLEYGKRLWRCDEYIGSDKPYPRVKLDTCYVIPNLSMGFIYMPADEINSFPEKIRSIIEDMDTNTKMTKLIENVSAYCAIESEVSIVRDFIIGDIGSKNRTTKSRFCWYIMEFPKDLNGMNGNLMTRMASIIYDKKNICVWKHDAIYYNNITVDDLQIFNLRKYRVNTVEHMEDLKLYNRNISLAKYGIINHLIRKKCIKYVCDYFRSTYQYCSNVFKNISVLELPWDDIKKFNIINQMVSKSINTRSGYTLYKDQTPPTPLEYYSPSDQEEINEEMLYNTCASCGLQLYGNIYCVSTLKQKQHILCTVNDKIYSIPNSNQMNSNNYTLICTACMYWVGSTWNYMQEDVFRTIHPKTLKDAIKPLKNKLGEYYDLIKFIDSAKDIVYNNSMTVFINDKSSCIHIITKTPSDILNYYDTIYDYIKNDPKTPIYVHENF